MEGFQVVSGGPLSTPLNGEVAVNGAKNSALKLMAASLLAEGRTTITNVPDILDVHVMARLLEELGSTVAIEPEGAVLSLRSAPNEVRAGPPYPSCDAEHIWRWLMAALADLGERFTIRAIVPTSYGSTAALVNQADLVLPILDREATPPAPIAAAYAEVAPWFEECHCPIDPAVGREDAGSIDQHDLRFVMKGNAHQASARGLCLGADDRDLLADERVHQGRLAGVGRAQHRNQAAAAH